MISWRWRNRFRRISSRCSLRPLWANSKTPFPKLFIVGAPRSGTTWINLIFANHSSVITENESVLYPVIMGTIRKFSARNPATWERLIDAYETPICHTVGVHRFVGNWMFRWYLSEVQTSLLSHPEWNDEDVANEIIGRIVSHFFIGHGGTRKHLFAEKTPAHVLYAREILKAFPEARILHVIRDGRDVCASLDARSKIADWAPRDRREQISIWKSHVDAGLNIARDPQFAGRIETVRYEDVLDDPIGEVSRLFDFAELPASSQLVRRVVGNTEFKRHRNKGPGMHNNKGVVGSWHNHFSESDERLFIELAGETSSQCGYRIDSSRAA